MSSIGEIDSEIDYESILTQWLQNEEVVQFQRSVETSIGQLLFSRELEDIRYIQMIQTLAWIGSSTDGRALLQKEIIEINSLPQQGVIPCSWGSDLWSKACKVGRFIADHKTEILVGAALCATGYGLAAATGYTVNLIAGGVVIAGAGSIFEKEKGPNPNLPSVPPPSSKEEISLVTQASSLPKLELPSSITQLLIVPNGLFINNQFFPTQHLLQHSFFAEELRKMAPFDRNLVSPDAIASIWEDAIKQSTALNISPLPYLPEAQPRWSTSFRMEGEQKHRCSIAWINGINNTLHESKTSARYIQELAGGHAVSGVYNCTHGALIDVLEAAFLNHQGYSPNTAQLLQAEWTRFHEENKDFPHARLLQICHSQGAIDVKNALTNAPLEIRDRVIVVAIAPAAIVPKRLCFRSYNYASEKDFVYKLQPPPPQPVVSLTIDEVIVPTFGEAIDDRDELIILKAHPEAEGIDHSFQSPTYQTVISDIIKKYECQRGQYAFRE
jgi:hypothetical protein